MPQQLKSHFAVLILGMHRSGTSLLSSLVQSLGISVGERLYPADTHNPAGYFEDRECVDIQERLLEALGQPWHGEKGMLPFPPLWWRQPEIRPLVEELEVWLDRRLRTDKRIWALKDPRTTRFLPLWNELLKKCGVTVRYLLGVREPAEMVASEVARNGAPHLVVYQTWLRYNLDALLHSGTALAGVFVYSSWFDDGATQMRRLAEALDLEISDKQLTTILDQRLRNELRRQNGFGSVPPVWASYLYNQLQALAFCLNTTETSRLATEAEYFSAILRQSDDPSVEGSLEVIMATEDDLSTALRLARTLQDDGVRLVVALLGSAVTSAGAAQLDVAVVVCELDGVEVQEWGWKHSRNAYVAWWWLRSRSYKKLHFIGGSGLGVHCLDARRQGLADRHGEIHVHYLDSPPWLNEGGRISLRGVDDVEAIHLEQRMLTNVDCNIEGHAALTNTLRQLAFRDFSQPIIPDTSEQTATPLVSVCITHYNRASLLSDCLESVRSQSYSPIEIVLVDDGSTDPASLALLNTLRDEFDAKGWLIIRQKNHYLGAARNTAVSAASGEYIFFLDDDNLLMLNGIARAVQIAQRTNAHIITAVMAVFSGPPGFCPKQLDKVTVFPGASSMLGIFGNCFGDAAALVRRSTWEAMNGFTEDRNVGAEDWEFFARSVLEGYHLEHSLQPFSWYRVNPQGMARSGNWLEDHHRALRAYEVVLPQALRELPELAGILKRRVKELEPYELEAVTLRDRIDQLNLLMTQTEWQLAQTHGELTQTQGVLTQTQWTSAQTQEALVQTQGELTKTQGVLDKTQGELTQIRRVLTRTEGQLTEAQREVALLQQVRHLLYTSRSWRLTAPLRAMKRQGNHLYIPTPGRFLRNAANSMRNTLRRRGIAGFVRRLPYYLRHRNTLWSLLAKQEKPGDEIKGHELVERRATHTLRQSPSLGNKQIDVLQSSLFQGEGFVRYRFDKNAIFGVDDDVLVYVAFCRDGRLTSLQIKSIENYDDEGYRVVLVINSGAYDRFVNPGQNRAIIQIVRENVGFDFGAWAHATQLIGGLGVANSVTFTNDSLIGPLQARMSIRLRDRINSVDADAVFMTENHEIKRHFQSYFFAFKTQALRKGALRLIQDALVLSDKHQVIEKEELTLVDRLERLEVSTAVAFPCAKANGQLKNPTIHYWGELIDAGFPFIKVSLITEGILQIDDFELTKTLGIEWLEILRTHILQRETSILGRQEPPVPDINVPPQPAIKIKARFSEIMALQAFNPAPAQNPPIIVPFDDIAESGFTKIDQLDIFVVIHCFYLDEAEEIFVNLAILPFKMRILLTTDTAEKAEQLDSLLLRHSLRAEIVITPNCGRDIAPFLIEGARHLSAEAIILHLHTKKSPHDSAYAGWGRFLRQNLIGSPEIVGSILYLLEQEEIGFVYSEHFHEVRELRNWGHDFPHARCLMERLNVVLSADFLLDFPTGSMFWAKAKALRPLFDLRLTYEDFEQEEGQTDGTFAHAIERCFLLVAEKQGFRHIKVIAHTQSYGTSAMSVSYREISYLLRRHIPRLLGVSGARPTFYSTIGEIYPVNVARSLAQGLRLNIVVPTMKPEKIYGGVSSAILCAKMLFEAMGSVSDIRLIVTSDSVDTASMREITERLGSSFTLVEPDDGVGGAVVVDLHTRRHLPLSLREGDIFFATAWWTADLVFRLRGYQIEMFSTAAKVIYLIQDYEPGFYPWSNKFSLAQATYCRSEETIALFNTEELANFFRARYSFSEAFHIPYIMNNDLALRLTPTVKKKTIIAYGRPSVARNLFETIVEGVRIWQGRAPELNCTYEVVFVGEKFDDSCLVELENARSMGKLSLANYANLLNEAAIGISLMVSPHPSYPPLEMASAGCLTITNCFESKDLGRRAGNIISLDVAVPDQLADALDMATARVKLGTFTSLVTMRTIPTEVPVVSYDLIACLLCFPHDGT